MNFRLLCIRRKGISMFFDYGFCETTLACSPQSSFRLINQQKPFLYYYVVLTCVNAQFETDERERFYNFLGGTIRAAGGAPEAIGGTANEIQMLVGFDSLSVPPDDFIRRLKLLSASWARRKTKAADFAWSEKVSAITIGEAQRERVRCRIFSQAKRLSNANRFSPGTRQITVAASF